MTHETRFRDLPIGTAFSFPRPSYADVDGYVKRSARGWSHPVYGNGRVGSIDAIVIPALTPAERSDAAAIDALADSTHAGMYGGWTDPDHACDGTGDPCADPSHGADLTECCGVPFSAPCAPWCINA